MTAVPPPREFSLASRAKALSSRGVEQLTRPERHYDKTFGMEIGTFAKSPVRPEGKTHGTSRERRESDRLDDSRRHELPAAHDTELTITMASPAQRSQVACGNPEDTIAQAWSRTTPAENSVPCR